MTAHYALVINGTQIEELQTGDSLNLASADIVAGLGFTPQAAGTYATGTGSASGTNTGDQTLPTLVSLGAYASNNPAGYTTNTGTVTSVSGTAPVVSSGGTTPAISMAAATTSVSGYLTTTDWNTFNGKQAALGFTPYNATNPSGYTSISNTNQLTNGAGFITSSGTSAACSGNAATATTATNLSGGTVAATTITATGNITAYYSDDRLKTNLGNIENALEKLRSLSGFYYEANETAQALGYEVVREVGVSAQSVLAVLPEIVVPAPIDEQYWTVRYEKLSALIIEAIKELADQVDVIKNKIG